MPVRRARVAVSKTGSLPELDLEKCTGCGICVERCPVDAVSIIDGKAVLVKPEACPYCTKCEDACPSGAIRCPFEIVLLVPTKTRKPPARNPNLKSR